MSSSLLPGHPHSTASYKTLWWWSTEPVKSWTNKNPVIWERPKAHGIMCQVLEFILWFWRIWKTDCMCVSIVFHALGITSLIQIILFYFNYFEFSRCFYPKRQTERDLNLWPVYLQSDARTTELCPCQTLLNTAEHFFSHLLFRCDPCKSSVLKGTYLFHSDLIFPVQLLPPKVLGPARERNETGN